jgi:(1->4)-alpha-D-glucan 1-alpha-D-glucosylmutase
MPGAWVERLERWEKINALRRAEAGGERVPDANDEYLFYQTVVGAWPPDLAPDQVERVQDFAERVGATMVKAVREAKERSSWSNPDAEYEAGLGRFVAGALDASRPNPFLQDLCLFVETLARPGAINSLAQTVIRLTAPGVPDLYQGAEFWDFSLVDPDNRRPVDFAARAAALAADAAPADLLASWRDGRVKQAVIARILRLRARLPTLFATGGYTRLRVEGAQADHVLAFARTEPGRAVVVAVTRLPAGFQSDPGPSVPIVSPAAWGETALVLPRNLAGRRMADALSAKNGDSGHEAMAAAGRLRLAELFAHLPVAVLEVG